MNTTTKVAIGALVAVAVGLGITLGVVLASDDDNGPNGPYYGMMRSTDWSQMQSYMRGVMGDDAYERMHDQMRQQGANGWSTQQMLDYMRGIMSSDAYNAMVEHMRQVWGEDWQDAMPMMWGMMGCWN